MTSCTSQAVIFTSYRRSSTPTTSASVRNRKSLTMVRRSLREINPEASRPAAHPQRRSSRTASRSLFSIRSSPDMTNLSPWQKAWADPNGQGKRRCMSRAGLKANSELRIAAFSRRQRHRAPRRQARRTRFGKHVRTDDCDFLSTHDDPVGFASSIRQLSRTSTCATWSPTVPSCA